MTIIDDTLSDPSFRIYGYSTMDILAMIRFMDTHMLKIEDLDNVEVKRYRRERDFIFNAMLERE